MPLRAVYKPEPLLRHALRVCLPYVAAAAMSAVALGLTLLLPGAFTKPFYIFFLTAAGICALLFGLAPGLVSVALNAVALTYFVLPETGRLRVDNVEDRARLFALVLMSAVIVAALARLRATQRALRMAHERFQLAHGVASIWAWEMELPSGNILWSSTPVAANIPQQQPIESWMQKIHPDDQSKVLAAIRMAAQSSRPYQTEFRVLTRGGSVRWIASSGEFYKNIDGDQRMIGVNVDITARKTAEAAREAAAKGEMAGELAHQINNPLQGLIHSLYLLHRQVAATEAERYSEVAQSEAQRVSQLVAEILRLYKRPA